MRYSYLKKLNLLRASDLMSSTSDNSQKYCRVMTVNEFHGMLLISQPSFTALAPGFGVRKINLVENRVGTFMSLHKEPIRDLACHPIRHDQLLSASQDKSVKLSNVATCQVMQRYECENEVWCCCWNLNEPDQFFVGTKRSEILLFDTRQLSTEPVAKLEFPVVERRPIISMTFIPRCPENRSFPCGGLLVLTLGSVWFFEDVTGSESTYKPHKLSISGAFWSMRFDTNTRLLLVSTRPTPHSKHFICELSQININDDPCLPPNHQVISNILFTHQRGGSYSERSFLRASIFQQFSSSNEAEETKTLLAYDRGCGQSDHKVVIYDVGKTEKAIQEMCVNRPVLDIVPYQINGEHHLAFLCEADVLIYKWINVT